MMQSIRYTFIFAVATIAAIVCLYGTARAGTCTVASASSIVSYNPFTAYGVLPAQAGAISISCSQEKGATVKVFVSGSATGYTTPFLTGPGGFTLSYTLCLPGTSCTATTNAWNMTNPYQFTPNGNGGSISPQFSVYAPQQDAPYGTTSQYTGNLYFTTTCNNVPC